MATRFTYEADRQSITPAGWLALAGADVDLTSDERKALEIIALLERVELTDQEQGQAPPAA